MHSPLPSLQWDDSLAIGHYEIDTQHRALFKTFGDFRQGCEQGVAPRALIELLNFLDRYVVLHFRTEEQLMERCRYPELEAHKEQHRRFVGRLAELKRELASRGTDPAVLEHANRVLSGWLIQHVREVDRQLIACLRQLRSVA